MNVTTLLVPLFAMAARWRGALFRPATMWTLATRRPSSCRWLTKVASWSGSAFGRCDAKVVGAANLSSIGSFGAAYMSVVLLEPLLTWACWRWPSGSG